MRFQDYKKMVKHGKNLLMRHDVDFSVHRSYALAKIEAEEGVHSTYFLWPHCKYYNLFEEEIVEIVDKIIELGHDIGLHFDYDFYKKQRLSILDAIEREGKLLECIFGVYPEAISFHNITKSANEMFEEYQSYSAICGMWNAHSNYIRENYEYVSDSNGYWRFKRLEDVLIESERNLHVLIHPEWWTPKVLSPRSRITRCIDGRTRKMHEWYDTVMIEIGRLNIL
jgi:hypothetical protein